MTKSEVAVRNSKPQLLINGRPIAPIAYITYFDERSCCEDFARAGYELFSVCASFSGLPLNSDTGFSPFTGIFDVKEKADFSLFDKNVRRLICACPNAKIFPRVRISMPQWWIDVHKDECCKGADGLLREALYSDEFKKTGEKMLSEFISHVQSSDYADSIIGYQISGGYTEEWFHFDSSGSISPCTEKYFNKYLCSHFPNKYGETVKIPREEEYGGIGEIKSERAKDFLSFVNNSISETISFFAKTVKKRTDFCKVVGTFFGYVAEVTNPFRGSSGLNTLLNCPYIDFICSPNSYAHCRALGRDWHEMSAGESIKLHGKLYFAENDIRTHLSDYPYNCRKGIDPQKKYSGPIWKGPPTLQQSIYAVRKAFARQMTHSNGLWWFDMWGGWYGCRELMDEMAEFARIAEALTFSENAAPSPQTVLIADESYNRRVGLSEPSAKAFSKFIDCLGNTGIPYDILLAEDYKRVLSYKAVILPYKTEYLSDAAKKLVSLCKSNGIAVITGKKDDASDIDTAVLRNILIQNNVHCFTSSDDVIYCGNGLLCIHAASGGKKTVKLEKQYEITPLCRSDALFVSDTVKLEMQEYETRIFGIRAVKSGKARSLT